MRAEVQQQQQQQQQQLEQQGRMDQRASEEFVTVVNVGQQLDNGPDTFVTVLSIGTTKQHQQQNGTTEEAELEEVHVYRLPGERLGFGLKFDGGNKTSERVRRLFIQSCAEQSPASRAKCSWGSLAEGDEVLSIDGVAVTEMTRLDCVRRLKESQLVIKLAVRHRGALRPEIVSAERKPTEQQQQQQLPPPPVAKVPPELPSAPPPVPPRKLRNANRGLADGESSPAKKAWDSPKSNGSSQNGSPQSQASYRSATSSAKSSNYESCSSSPVSKNLGSGPKNDPVKDPTKAHASPVLNKIKQEVQVGPAEAAWYLDARSQDGSSTHGSTSDETSSSLSTVVERLSSGPEQVVGVVAVASAAPADFLLARLANSEARTHVEPRGEVELVTALVAPNTVLIEETPALQPPPSFQDAPLSYGHEPRPGIFFSADLAADSSTHFRPIRDDAELVRRVVAEAAGPPLPARTHVARIPVNGQLAAAEPPKPMPRKELKPRRKRPPPPPPPPRRLPDTTSDSDNNNNATNKVLEIVEMKKAKALSPRPREAASSPRSPSPCDPPVKHDDDDDDDDETRRSELPPCSPNDHLLLQLLDAADSPNDPAAAATAVDDDVEMQQLEEHDAGQRSPEPTSNQAEQEEEEVEQAQRDCDEEDVSDESDPDEYYWQTNLATIGEEEENNSLEYNHVDADPSSTESTENELVSEDLIDGPSLTSDRNERDNKEPDCERQIARNSIGEDKQQDKTAEEVAAAAPGSSLGEAAAVDGRMESCGGGGQRLPPDGDEFPAAYHEFVPAQQQQQQQHGYVNSYALYRSNKEEEPPPPPLPLSSPPAKCDVWRAQQLQDNLSEASVKDKIAMFSRSSSGESSPRQQQQQQQPAPLARATSFSGSTGLSAGQDRLRAQAGPIEPLSRANSLASSYKRSLSQADEAATTGSRRTSLSLLIEQRRKAISKLRGLVIPEKDALNDTGLHQPIVDLPEIKSRDSILCNAHITQTMSNVHDKWGSQSSLASNASVLGCTPARSSSGGGGSSSNSSSSSSSSGGGGGSSFKMPAPKMLSSYSPAFKRKSLAVYSTGSQGSPKQQGASSPVSEAAPKSLESICSPTRSDYSFEFGPRPSSAKLGSRKPGRPGPAEYDDSDNDSAVSSSQSSISRGFSPPSSPGPAEQTDLAQSRRLLKPQSVEAINRKNILASARCRSGQDLNGSPLIQRKLFPDQPDQPGTQPLKPEIKIAYIEIADPTPCSSQSKPELLDSPNHMSSWLRNEMHSDMPTSTAAFSCDSAENSDSSLERNTTTESADPHHDLLTVLTTKSRSRSAIHLVEDTSNGKLKSQMSLEEMLSHSSSRISLEDKEVTRMAKSSERPAEERPLPASRIPSLNRANKIDQEDKPDPASRSCAGLVSKIPTAASRKLPQLGRRSASVTDMKKVFERLDVKPSAPSVNTNQSPSGVVHSHGRFPSLDSSNLEEREPRTEVEAVEQFGSISSLASSTSLISQQELAQLVEEASLEEPRGGHDKVVVVVLHKDKPGGSVGIILAGGSDCETKEISVHRVLGHSIAEREGSLQRGDRILSINGRSMRGLSHRESLAVLKQPRSELVLVVSRPQPSLCSRANSVETIVEGHETSSLLDSSSSTAWGPPLTLLLHKDGAGLGFSLEGGRDSPIGDRPLLIKKIFTGGAAEKTGALRPGDQLIEVNKRDVSRMSRIEAWSLMKRLPDGPVNLLVRHPATKSS